jgi:two-component system sensor histidine kinase UhpB
VPPQTSDRYPETGEPGSTEIPDAAAWAEMLAIVAEKYCRFNNLLQQNRERESPQRSLLRELERERARIGRELHAGAGQPLAGIRLNLDMLDEWSQSMPEAAKEAMSRLHRLSEAALQQVRAVSHRLQPPEWQQLSTEQAIRQLVADSGLTGRLETAIDIRPLPVEPTLSTRIALYRAAQECISNVLRHSGATRVELSLLPMGDRIELRVADNGKGILPESLSGGGMGLKAIRAHAASVDGVSRIASGLHGTTITIDVPVSEN